MLYNLMEENSVPTTTKDPKNKNLGIRATSQHRLELRRYVAERDWSFQKLFEMAVNWFILSDGGKEIPCPYCRAKLTFDGEEVTVKEALPASAEMPPLGALLPRYRDDDDGQYLVKVMSLLQAPKRIRDVAIMGIDALVEAKEIFMSSRG